MDQTSFDPSSPNADPALRDVVAVGNRHSCFLMESGALKCVGQNLAGQLGNGTTTANEVTPVTAIDSDVIRAAAGDSHTCAILSDETVQCWGRNTEGQLGTGDKTDSPTPVAVTGLTGVRQLALGQQHSCALLSDKTVQCWGNNDEGQLGDSTTTERLSPTEVSGLSGVKSIDAQRNHTCAVLEDETLRCWGRNTAGQLGNGSDTDSPIPVVVTDLANVASVSAGNLHTCAVLTDGTAKCWGRNNFGQLGTGADGADEHTPVDVTEVPEGISFAIAKGERVCFALTTGGIRCMGFGGQGQLGNGADDNSVTAVSVSNITAVVTGMKGNQDHNCLMTSEGGFSCWGFADSGQLGDETDSGWVNTPVEVLNL